MSSDRRMLEPGAISTQRLSKVFDRRPSERSWRNAAPVGRPDAVDPATALRQIDLAVDPGEAVGIIGANGAGKSTLLKVLADVLAPTSGSVEYGGRLGAIIELGLGFHPDLTGWENARASCVIQGMSKGQLESSLPEIVEFSGLGSAMDQPLRQFSTGMRARLGFALATHAPTDILAVDEVLAVGDVEFQERCFDRIRSRVEGGTTLLFVSHEMWMVEMVCDRVIQLDGGRVVADGPASDIITNYLSPAPRPRTVPTNEVLQLERFNIDPPQVPALSELRFTARLVANRAAEDVRLDTEFGLATAPADATVAHSTQRVADRIRAGQELNLEGRSSVFPTDSGHFRVRCRVVAGDDDAVSDEATADFWIDGTRPGRRPQMALEVDTAVTNLAPESENRRRHVLQPVGGAQSRVSTTQLTKAFRPRSNRGLDRRVLPGRLGAADRDGKSAVDSVTTLFRPGTTTGIIGANGAGKTTFLKLVAGTMEPSAGTLAVDGRVVSLLDVGLGFHGDLTGRENVVITTQLLGLRRADVDRQLGEIHDFSGLGEALDQPVRQYSTGMRARLGLAVALHANPGVLLIDETLSVGDEDFRRKAILAVEQLRSTGTSILFVSHDLRLVEEVCDRVIRMDRGRVIEDGPTAEVLPSLIGDGEAGALTEDPERISVGQLVLRRHRVVTGGALEVSGTVEVRLPSPTTRLELAYLVRLDDRDFWSMDEEELRLHEIVTETVVSAGRELAEPGHYRFDCTISPNALIGDVDLIVRAVDEFDGTTQAMAWHAVTFGNTRPVGLTPVSVPVKVAWYVRDRESVT